MSTFSFNSAAQRGQVLLIVVLVMVVALTVGLSVATRSITNVRTTTEEENSQRAFSAAEAGIERVLKDPTSPLANVDLGNQSMINTVSVAQITKPAATSLLLNNSDPALKDIGVDVWFADHTVTGQVDTSDTGLWRDGSATGASVSFLWGRTTANCELDIAALEIIFLWKDTGNNLVTTHQTIDPCVSRAVLNGFTSGNTGAGGGAQGGIPNITITTTTEHNLGYKVTFPNLTRLILARVVPLYKSSRLAVDATGLPSQGQIITSTGSSGETFRKITVAKPYPQIPTELFSVLFSPNR